VVSHVTLNDKLKAFFRLILGRWVINLQTNFLMSKSVQTFCGIRRILRGWISQEILMTRLIRNYITGARFCCLFEARHVSGQSRVVASIKEGDPAFRCFDDLRCPDNERLRDPKPVIKDVAGKSRLRGDDVLPGERVETNTVQFHCKKIRTARRFIFCAKRGCFAIWGGTRINWLKHTTLIWSLVEEAIDCLCWFLYLIR